jgi:hypothetical protein
MAGHARGPAWRVRRRTLLGAAAAGALGALAGADRAHADPLWYQQAFAARVAADPGIRGYLTVGQEFWYRPRQLLVAPPDLARVLARLVAMGHTVGVGVPFAGVQRVVFALDVNIKVIVDDLRAPAAWLPAAPPAVQPHHVAFGYPNVMGNPSGPPATVTEQRPPQPDGTGAGLLVGICDTGIWAQAAVRHPAWLGGYTATEADVDPLYSSSTTLALEAGHGTFIAGVLRRAAPAVGFDPTVALSPDGIGDEESVCAALDALDPAVAFINLSLGCYTQGDRPSMPLGNAIAGRAAVVVAAAGNASSTRPTWPAALPHVVAVAALSRTRAGLLPAGYSNHGPWIDLCAPGDWSGPYVTGTLVPPKDEPVVFDVPPKDEPVVFDGWAAWEGTSFAVPYTIGRMAALVGKNKITPAAAAALLQAGPAPFPSYGAIVP